MLRTKYWKHLHLWLLPLKRNNTENSFMFNIVLIKEKMLESRDSRIWHLSYFTHLEWWLRVIGTLGLLCQAGCSFRWKCKRKVYETALNETQPNFTYPLLSSEAESEYKGKKSSSFLLSGMSKLPNVFYQNEINEIFNVRE